MRRRRRNSDTNGSSPVEETTEATDAEVKKAEEDQEVKAEEAKVAPEEVVAESGVEPAVVAPVEATPVVAEPVKEIVSQPTVVEEPVSRPPPKPKNEPQLTFTMYCRQKGIPDRHRAGMRAFTKVQRATFNEWERVFSHY